MAKTKNALQSSAPSNSNFDFDSDLELKSNSNSNDHRENEINTNIKARHSDENLSIAPGQSLPCPVNERLRKRSIVSSLQGGSSEGEDEFLFIRMRKHIKSHWKKIMEHNPNGTSIFKSPQPATSNAQISRNNSINSTTLTVEPTVSSAALFEQTEISSAIKSALLLPSFSCKRDDEGRPIVPFISSFLQVSRVLYFYYKIITNPHPPSLLDFGGIGGK